MNITKYKLTIVATALCLMLAFANFGQTPSDANTLFDEAMRLFREGTAESYLAAQTKFEAASELFRQVGNKQKQAESLVWTGYAASKLGEKVLALKYYNVALPLFRAVSDKHWEAGTLNNIGAAYFALGKNQEALNYYNLALLLFKTGKISGEALTLKNIGLVYDSLGDKQKALDYYNLALRILLEVGDKNSGLATLFASIGKVYSDLGEKQKALNYYNQALPIFKATGDRGGEAGTLNNIGKVFSDLGENQKALDYLNQALLILRALGNKVGEAITLNNIGRVYSDLGMKPAAAEFYKLALPLLEQSLTESQSKNDKKGEVTTSSNLGEIYEELGNEQKALYLYSQTLLLARQYNFLPEQANALSNLMFYWMTKGNLNLAIYIGKESVNIFQQAREIRTKSEDENKLLAVSLRHSDETYRTLADLLVSNGRFFEAQQVLAMLKEDEYFGYVRRDLEEIKKLSTRADLRADERAALEKYETLAGKLTEYGTQFVKLEELKQRQGTDFKQQAEYDGIKTKLDTANAAFRIFLDKGLVTALGKPVVKKIKEDRTLIEKLQKWGNGTVALYTVAADDRYRVILTTQKTQKDGKTEIKIADLNRKIFEFRAALQNPLVDPRPLGKELYDILIKPIEKDLIAAEAKTLVWSLDGTLRYIPFAALSPDGIHYLAEKYQTVVVTSTTRQSLVAEVNPNWRLLGAGVTKESKLIEPNGTREIEFRKLPGVRDELLTIVSNEDAQMPEKGLMAGKRLIDDGFNLTALENGMSQRVGDKETKKPKYNVIHLATHFRLGGDTAKSFLLMGGNQALTLEKVSDNTALNFGDVELVTLSACNTGFGTAIENKVVSKEQERKLLEANNGVEVDSLATFIELRGAKSVLASLWAVADESTQLLMSEFYRLRKENPKLTKAEAMQLAQQAMLGGRLKPMTAEGKAAVCQTRDAEKDVEKFVCDASKPYAHPYFWSAFVLIGNWR